MKTVISKDGAPIAFDRSGEGAPIIPQVLAPVLEEFFKG